MIHCTLQTKVYFLFNVPSSGPGRTKPSNKTPVWQHGTNRLLLVKILMPTLVY